MRGIAWVGSGEMLIRASDGTGARWWLPVRQPGIATRRYKRLKRTSLSPTSADELESAQIPLRAKSAVRQPTPSRALLDASNQGRMVATGRWGLLAPLAMLLAPLAMGQTHDMTRDNVTALGGTVHGIGEGGLKQFQALGAPVPVPSPRVRRVALALLVVRLTARVGLCQPRQLHLQRPCYNGRGFLL
jgi:hypothetical protein